MADWISGNRYLSMLEMENNATIFWLYMQPLGWSLEAVAGMLGNIQNESNINPGVYQQLDPSHSQPWGYGLVQWTPYTKLQDYAASVGEDWRLGNTQCDMIDWEFVTNNGQYNPNLHPSDLPYLSTADFKVSTRSPEDLSAYFLFCYERPGSPETKRAARAEAARAWYEFLGGIIPPPPPPHKSKGKWWMYMRNHKRL